MTKLLRQAIIIALLGSNSTSIAEPTQGLPDGGFTVHSMITQVVTGADIVIEGKVIHLDGLRAPKRGRTCLRNGDTVDIGTEVADGLRQKLGAGEAFIEAHTDSTGKLVGGGMINGVDIGEIAVRNGYAVSKIGSYNYANQERETRASRFGLWSCSSFPKQEGTVEMVQNPATITTPISGPTKIIPRPQPLPAPSPRAGIKYAPEDVQIPYQTVEPEDDFDLVLDEAGGFFEDVFNDIDRGIRDLFHGPPLP